MPPNNFSSYIQGDPIYARVRAQANRDLGATLGRKFTEQQQLLMQLGNVGLARSAFATNPFAMRVFGRGKDREVRAASMGGRIRRQITPYERKQMQAIRQARDPDTGTSVFAKIAHAFQEQREGANEEMNQQGLFFGGQRAKALAELTRGRQFQEAESLFGAQQGLNAILNEILQARQQRRALLTSAAEQAYQRALAEELAG